MIAKRLCDAADGRPDPGVGPGARTRRLARRLPLRAGRADARSRVSREPIAAARAALGRRTDRDSSRRDAIDPREIPMVGRASELRALEDELARAVGRRVPHRARARRARRRQDAHRHRAARRHRDEVIGLVARAYPLGATASLGLWTEAIERHLRSLDAEAVRSLAARTSTTSRRSCRAWPAHGVPLPTRRPLPPCPRRARDAARQPRASSRPSW